MNRLAFLARAGAAIVTPLAARFLPFARVGGRSAVASIGIGREAPYGAMLAPALMRAAHVTMTSAAREKLVSVSASTDT